MELFILQVFVFSALLLIIARLLPGVEVRDFGQALLAAFVLSVLNALVKPLILLITLPVIVLTLGLFVFAVNAGMIMLTSRIVEGFKVDSFTTALLASLLLTVFTLGWAFLA